MSLRIPLNLFLFGVFTSLGYVAFAVFLPSASSGALLLNTYVWIFGFRVFANGLRRPRWPTESLRILIDTNDLLFAACAFCYWCLFWFGIRLIPGGNEASQSAVAFLALNSVLLPIASHFAVEKSRRGKYIWLYLGCGLILILSVFAMQLDSTAGDLGAGFASVLSGLKLAFTAPRTFWNQIARTSPSTAWISVPALCFILAICIEACGDFFTTRREEIAKTSAGADLSQLQQTAAKIIYVRKFIRKQLLGTLAESAIKVEGDQLIRMREKIAPLFKAAPEGIERKRQQELAKELMAAIDEANDNIEFLNRIQNQIKSGGERTVVRRDRRRLFRIAEQRCWRDMITRSSAESKDDLEKLARDIAKHAGSDLMAVLGLALALVIFFATGAALPEVTGTEIIGAVLGSIMLGGLGSSARILFITPMIRRETATAALVPPVYAIRPFILLVIILLVQAVGLTDWLATSGIAPAALKLSVDHNEGWVAGALLAGCAAIVVFMMSIFDIRRRRSERSDLTQA